MRNKKPPVLTLEMLVGMKACIRGLDHFKAVAPDGSLTLDAKGISKFLRHGLKDANSPAIMLYGTLSHVYWIASCMGSMKENKIVDACSTVEMWSVGEDFFEHGGHRTLTTCNRQAQHIAKAVAAILLGVNLKKVL